MSTRDSSRGGLLDSRRPRRPALRWPRARLQKALTFALLLTLVPTVAGCTGDLNRLTREISRSTVGTVGPTTPTPPPSTSSTVVPATPASTVRPLTLLAKADWDIAEGHFFTQTNGQPSLSSPTGFAVTDKDGVPFWSEFQRLGGVPNVGYPLSPRLTYQGKLTQVFQRVALQWNPQSKRLEPMNLLSALEDAGKGAWLSQAHGVPPRLSGEFDRGKGPDQIVRDRLTLLNANKAIMDRFNAVPDSLGLFGLPDSQVVDQGDHQALRTQRTVLRLWKENKPWARAGEVTVDNTGEYALEAGLFAKGTFAAEQPPSAPVVRELSPVPSASVVQAARTATATAQATPPSRAWVVGNTDGDGVYLRRTPTLSDKMAPWADGAVMRDLNEKADGDGVSWIKVQAPDGSVGWVPTKYLKPVP